MTDQDNERVRGLVEALQEGSTRTMRGSWAETYARRILSDQPSFAKALLAAGFDVQVFLDVAVEEGELRDGGTGAGLRWYGLPKPKPHVHEPQFAGFSHGVALFRCRDVSCDALLRLPIEWPEEG
jgi:hypothetical protein